jgi:hypothetical protein
MKFESTGDEQRMGFEVHPKGTFVFQIQQGIDFIIAEDTSKQTLKIPCKSVKLIEGNPDDVGGDYMEFLTLITKDGKQNKSAERTINNLINWNGKAADFEKRFPGDIPYTDPKFIAGLKLKLPGMVFEGELNHREWQGNTNANLKTMRNAKKKSQAKAAVPLPETPGEPTVTDDTGSDGDDW